MPTTDDPVAGTDTTAPSSPSSATANGAVTRVPLIALCVTEITSWGILYYAFPVLAPDINHDTGWSTGAITAAFSVALVLAALGGIPIGRALDRHGPRLLMTGGSLLGVLAVLGMAAAPNLFWFVAAWMLAGAAMSAVLYQPAFAALTRYYAPRHLGALTTLTLVAGLASTVFAPLTNALAAEMSWRTVYLVLAVVLAVVTIPLHYFALRRPWPPPHVPDTDRSSRIGRDQVSTVVRSSPFLLMTAALTLSAFSMYAVLTNLIPLLTSRGASSSVAAWALGLGGIGQVAGRLGYATLTRRLGVRTRTVCILAGSAVTTTALAVLPGPVPLLIAVAVLGGTTRGIATLLQATAVSDRWGTAVYGSLSGVMAAPVTIAGAIAPAAGAALAVALGGYPTLFTALAATAVLAAALATGSVPGAKPDDLRDQTTRRTTS
ncbi:MFS family permease [Actinomadura luteofluorescens]|uniref:MFS family permease n=1 Tax=Actinomadura luteofluorescens TaxID=46163 RepID=A0A7Y9ERI8_9ACTN|nr:MFS transporter [Actinomadura luteofluorescens]NYD51785.1 MFS family permease [Actinomadura luteofluorescens]